VSKVKEGWVGSSILVVGEHQASIVMHALANKAAKKNRQTFSTELLWKLIVKQNDRKQL
jgi:hypothetical protein